MIILVWTTLKNGESNPSRVANNSGPKYQEYTCGCCRNIVHIQVYVFLFYDSAVKVAFLFYFLLVWILLKQRPTVISTLDYTISVD